MIQDIENGKILPGSTVVCTLTGHGLKDAQIAVNYHKSDVKTVAPETKLVKEMIEKYI